VLVVEEGVTLVEAFEVAVPPPCAAAPGGEAEMEGEAVPLGVACRERVDWVEGVAVVHTVALSLLRGEVVKEGVPVPVRVGRDEKDMLPLPPVDEPLRDGDDVPLREPPA